jgi:serine/threonine protein kinase/tetratricopeptide (TPR) repeat protein
MDLLAGKTFCETCGSSLKVDMPSGFCPACLLTTALNSPDVPSSGSRIEDYELLNEIARGGMGIVYRARQRTPSRIVALKMILPVHLRSSGAVNRFRTEAEAAASLDHECILPIYSVGEQDGAPFYSMKFAEGGPLSARIENYRNKINETAALIAKLARAIAYAHERGILHRDLKPGNILFDGAGKPYVSDFGVAKWLQRECDLTQTLAILGTPFYMAPEQAADSRAVGAAADVYSLGAILYQMLTGHPPVSGDTAMEVLRRAAEQAPRRPSLTNHHVPRDLETICLKCLEKEPASRYSSAVALAEDLERFCAGCTIQARPAGLTTQTWRWIRRNPAIVGLIAALLALAVSLSGIVWRDHIPRQSNGVAVLPFENLGADPENGYFADGIQQEILNRLSKIADLKVISRASTQRYQSKPRNLAEIAKELGVENVLEGSVQKSGDQVRVNVQLIKAPTRSQLWAETYDRSLTDVFAIEGEIAKRIAESLQGKISGHEEQSLVVKPTSNSEAYDAYLRGLAFEVRSHVPSWSTSADLVWKAIGFYERAVQLDPKFAVAWARLSRLDSYLTFNPFDPVSAARREPAKRALENAQGTERNSAEATLALGYYQYWVLRDYGRAKTTFGHLSKSLPSSSEVPTALGLISRREGNWDQSIAWFEQALALDPRNVELIIIAAETYGMHRRFETALRLYDRALDIIPNDPDVMAGKASIYQAQGNLSEAASLLSEVSAETPAEETFHIKITQLRLERNYAQAIRLLQARRAQFHFKSQYEKALYPIWIAFMQRVAGDLAGAKATAAEILENLDALSSDPPDKVVFAAALSQLYAAKGEKDPALNAAEQAIAALPNPKEGVTKPSLEQNLALIQTIFGENNRAILILTHLLQTSYGTWLYDPVPITPSLLKLDPLWDPLRNDPQFQRLLAGD